MLQPNSTRGRLDDKRVRQALNYAIEPPAHGRHRPARHDDAAGPAVAGRIAREPARKERFSRSTWTRRGVLLPQAGVSGFTLDLLYSSVSLEGSGFAQIYQADLAQIGVNGVIRTLEPAALLDAWHTQNFGLYFASDPWSNLEPVTQFTSGSTTNYRGNNGGYLSDDYTGWCRPPRPSRRRRSASRCTSD